MGVFKLGIVDATGDKPVVIESHEYHVPEHSEHREKLGELERPLKILSWAIACMVDDGVSKDIWMPYAKLFWAQRDADLARARG